MMKVKRIYSALLSALFFIALSTTAHAAEPVSKSLFGGVAIEGHDSVAYHSEASAVGHTAIEGSQQFLVKYKGAKWYFSNADNARQFEATPEKYAPAYNGHCANALSLGEGLIKTDGTHWQIFDDQLYLFYAARGRDRWLDGDYVTYKKEADKAWQEIIANQ